ncbi:MAG: hypothetical protein WDM87_11020 [Terracidiphilus sp.]
MIENIDEPDRQRALRGKESPMFPFDVILFDVGGVLLTNGWDHGERAAAVERFGLDAADFEARHEAVYPAWGEQRNYWKDLSERDGFL